MPVASLRPTDLAERWVVAAIGAQFRIQRGEDPVPPFEQHAAEELKSRPGMHRGEVNWYTAAPGPVVAQLHDDLGVQVYQLVAGRDLDDISSLLTDET
jgi:hypothetical protein